MSHVAVRIVANWLARADVGVDAVAALVPLDAGDVQPPTVTIYDETRHGWVGRRQVPQPNTAIQFPAVIVFLQHAKSDAGIPDRQSTGARTVNATVPIIVQLLMDDSSTETAAADGMYLLRAIRNSLLQLDAGASQAARTLLQVRLDPAESVTQGQMEAPQGDSVISLGVLAVTYPVTEVTVLT